MRCGGEAVVSDGAEECDGGGAEAGETAVPDAGAGDRRAADAARLLHLEGYT